MLIQGSFVDMTVKHEDWLYGCINFWDLCCFPRGWFILYWQFKITKQVKCHGLKWDTVRTLPSLIKLLWKEAHHMPLCKYIAERIVYQIAIYGRESERLHPLVSRGTLILQREIGAFMQYCTACGWLMDTINRAFKEITYLLVLCGKCLKWWKATNTAEKHQCFGYTTWRIYFFNELITNKQHSEHVIIAVRC